ncbi:MAG: 3-hydroxyacyl-CoA dehydrogenase NAD-binding domain-containing protein [Pseudomonadota bacterium]
MARKEPRAVRRIVNIGAGPIGGGWSAHFLARGYDVTTYLHDAAEEPALRALIDTAWISLEALGLAEGASRDRLTCTTDLAAAVSHADFVQESVPESLTLKQALYRELGVLVPEGVVIASSTSGLPMSDIQADCPTPERTVVGHPFNPPYLLPLVEVVGGGKTAPETVDWVARFYRLTGKSPLVMERELPGFVATRLQEALWREALHMVANGEATVEQIDQAIVQGPGPRWAVLGPCMAFHVASGEGGMAHNLDHFGPALKLPWTRLEAPELTQELRDRMVDGCDRASAGEGFEALAAARDAAIVAVLKSR